MASIQGIYIALFGRPADPNGLAYWNGVTNNGSDLSKIVGALAGTKEYTERFAGTSNADIVTSIYQSLFGRTPDAGGLKFFTDGLAKGTLKIETIAINILDGAQGSDRTIIDGKIAAGNLFTSHLDLPNEVAAYNGNAAAQIGRDYVASISANNPGTPTNADAAISKLLPSGGQAPSDTSGSAVSEPPAPPVNHAPTVADASFKTNEGSNYSGKVTGQDADSDKLAFSIVDQAKHGTVTITADGNFQYSPIAKYSGSDSFTYKANDGKLDSKAGTVSINVEHVNHAPVTSADSFSVVHDRELTINKAKLLLNDSDPDNDALTLANLGSPAHGTLTDNGNGSLIYKPGENYTGSDSFTYTASDGHLQSGLTEVNILVTDNAPVANLDSYTVSAGGSVVMNVLFNDGDADGDKLSIVSTGQADHGTVSLNKDGTLAYLADKGYFGGDEFTYTISDGIQQSSSKVRITETHTKPVANDDYITFDENTHRAIGNILSNDTLSDGAAFSVASHGDVFVIHQSPNLTVISLNKLTGEASVIFKDNFYVDDQYFQYVIWDNLGQSNIGTVRIDNGVLVPD